jgi:hypothetical protein
MHFVNKGKKMRRKQLSWMSSGKVVRRPPRGTVFEDGVEDREQFSHASHQSHLLRFAAILKFVLGVILIVSAVRIFYR